MPLDDVRGVHPDNPHIRPPIFVVLGRCHGWCDCDRGVGYLWAEAAERRVRTHRRADLLFAQIRAAADGEVEHLREREVVLAERGHDRLHGALERRPVAAWEALPQHVGFEAQPRHRRLEEQDRFDGPAVGLSDDSGENDLAAIGVTDEVDWDVVGRLPRSARDEQPFEQIGDTASTHAPCAVLHLQHRCEPDELARVEVGQEARGLRPGLGAAHGEAELVGRLLDAATRECPPDRKDVLDRRCVGAAKLVRASEGWSKERGELRRPALVEAARLCQLIEAGALFGRDERG